MIGINLKTKNYLAELPQVKENPDIMNHINLLNSEISDLEWDSFVYYRNNPRGKHLELWHHTSGCRRWFKVHRNTATHEIIKTLEIQEELHD